MRQDNSSKCGTGRPSRIHPAIEAVGKWSLAVAAPIGADYRFSMQSKATTVTQYLAELPPDRLAAVSAVREVILSNLDGGYVEGMQYGMIGYYVPHSIFPAGYHCDPKQPLPFAHLASQKNYMSLYLMCLYGGCDGQSNPMAVWFQKAWQRSGKKLDMGKACIRFKSVDDLALDVIGEAIRRMPAKKYIASIESAISTSRKKVTGKARATATRRSGKTR